MRKLEVKRYTGFMPPRLYVRSSYSAHAERLATQNEITAALNGELVMFERQPDGIEYQLTRANIVDFDRRT